MCYQLGWSDNKASPATASLVNNYKAQYENETVILLIAQSYRPISFFRHTLTSVVRIANQRLCEYLSNSNSCGTCRKNSCDQFFQGKAQREKQDCKRNFPRPCKDPHQRPPTQSINSKEMVNATIKTVAERNLSHPCKIQAKEVVRMRHRKLNFRCGQHSNFIAVGLQRSAQSADVWLW